ncbi:MAG TPA: protein translocase subunit SecD [Solirubrobacterales bacterium]|nr:protein translocase subunit SecD [Solirubrobacterales bacterium]
MDRAWYWKAGFIVLVTIAAVYALVPSWTYFKLPAETRNEAGEFDKARPKWAPARHLNLGLDLQGGIHLVMKVEVDRAVREKAVRRAEEIHADLERRDLKGAEVKGDPETGIVTVTAKTDFGKVKDRVAEDYPDMYVRSSSGDTFSLSMKDDAVRELKSAAVDQAVKAIRNRVDKWGVSEPTIAKRGETNILVQLPGYSNPEKAKELLGKTAQLEFKIADDQDQSLAALQSQLPAGITLDFERNEGPGGAIVTTPYLRSKDRQALYEFAKKHAPEGKEFGINRQEDRLKREVTYRTFLLDKKANMTGEYITDARVAFDQNPGEQNRPYVQITFNQRGAELFGKLTSENVRRRMAIVLDENVDSAPVIQGPIPGGICSIHLGGLKPINEILNEAKDLALVLKSGALPAPVRIEEERSVGASLGPELIRKGSYSALLGILAVLLFMAIYYRFSGIVADVALVLNGLVVLAIMALIDSTLTLPGIAGFVLTLGMAVDANVLINERIREELREGKSMAVAVKNGYDKVFWTIFDGHVTALVAGFVIRAYGSGPVRGFATTLIIGLLASMFTSIVVTRAIVEWFVSHGRLHKAVSF